MSLRIRLFAESVHGFKNWGDQVSVSSMELNHINVGFVQDLSGGVESLNQMLDFLRGGLSTKEIVVR